MHVNSSFHKTPQVILSPIFANFLVRERNQRSKHNPLWSEKIMYQDEYLQGFQQPVVRRHSKDCFVHTFVENHKQTFPLKTVQAHL